MNENKCLSVEEIFAPLTIWKKKVIDTEVKKQVDDSMDKFFTERMKLYQQRTADFIKMTNDECKRLHLGFTDLLTECEKDGFIFGMPFAEVAKSFPQNVEPFEKLWIAYDEFKRRKGT